MTHDNPIDWFQETTGGKFPEKVEALLRLMAGYEGTIEILFGVPKKLWRFKVLDFQLLHSNMHDPAYTTDDYTERLTNPYLIVQEINEHFEERFGEEGMPGIMLPFAVDVNGDGLVFLCFKPADSRVYLCNINATLPLEVVTADVEELLGSIDGIIKSIDEEGKTSFDIFLPKRGPSLSELIPEENMLVCEAECTGDVTSYKWVIEELMKISDGLLTLESFEGTNGDTRTLRVTINGLSGEFSVKGKTEYVDSAALIRELNALLESVMYGHLFIDVDDSEGELLEVAFGDQATYELLLKNKLVAEWQMKKS